MSFKNIFIIFLVLVLASSALFLTKKSPGENNQQSSDRVDTGITDDTPDSTVTPDVPVEFESNGYVVDGYRYSFYSGENVFFDSSNGDAFVASKLSMPDYTQAADGSFILSSTSDTYSYNALKIAPSVDEIQNNILILNFALEFEGAVPTMEVKLSLNDSSDLYLFSLSQTYIDTLISLGMNFGENESIYSMKLEFIYDYNERTIHVNLHDMEGNNTLVESGYFVNLIDEPGFVHPLDIFWEIKEKTINKDHKSFKFNEWSYDIISFEAP